MEKDEAREMRGDISVQPDLPTHHQVRVQSRGEELEHRQTLFRFL